LAGLGQTSRNPTLKLKSKARRLRLELDASFFSTDRTTFLAFTLAICYRPSVCLSVVCNVRAPYSGDWNFRQCFYAI